MLSGGTHGLRVRYVPMTGPVVHHAAVVVLVVVMMMLVNGGAATGGRAGIETNKLNNLC